jgi:hypothetical protein
MTDYKQLCADLFAWSETTSSHYYSQPGVIIRARAALAEPEPKGPTVMQIIALADEIEKAELGQVDLVRAALARWGNHPESPDSSTQPIPVSERLPGPEGPTDEEEQLDD